jgi:hypothetical protein
MPFLQEQKTVTGAQCFSYDAKDYDITGAMFVTTRDEVNFYAVVGKDLFWLLTGVG